MNAVLDNGGRMQEQAREPVIEDSTLPTMEPATYEEAPEAEVATGASGADTLPSASQAGGQMEPFIPEEEPPESGAEYMAPATTAAEESRLPEQQERPPEPGEERAAEGEGYIRLSFRAEEGQLYLVGARSVPGPLIAEQDIRAAELVYEVARGQQRIAAGSIPPDAHLVRGMMHPEATGDLAGHHIAERDVLEFTARVSRRELPYEALPELGAAVYRVKGGGTLDVPATAAPLRETEASGRLRVIAELHGVDAERLPSELQEQLRSALP